MTDRFDVVVIGSGPGGYIAAIRAAQLGLKTACVEKDKTLGGTCLNVGCIPSKALLQSSHLYEEAKHSFGTHGIKATVELDLKTMLERKDKVVKGLTGGVASLFTKYKVQRVNGFGRIAAPGKVEVKGDDGKTQTLDTARILIATGSVVSQLRGVTIDNDRVVDSTGALSFPEVPKHLVIIGAGVIGLELGSVWRRLGATVTVLEYLDRILNGIDTEIATTAQRIFKQQGIEFQLGRRVQGASVKKGEVTIEHADAGGKVEKLACDRLLVATGRKPFTDGLGVQELGITMDKLGRIVVNGHFETNVPGIFAIGDVIPGAMLAHKAEEEGVVCVEHMAGKKGHINYDAIPNVIYTHPEIAAVGKTEEELKKDGIPYKKGSFPFKANSRARAIDDTNGLVKFLAHEKTDRILGAHIIGPQAGDLIAECAVAIEFEGSAEDIARSSHAHPTLAEAVKEAAMSVGGHTLNF